MKAILSPGQLEALRGLDACTVADAIETFQVRLRNEGFVNSSIRCQFPQQPPLLGYACTLKVRGSAPSTAGSYEQRTDWYDYVLSVPAPRVVVVQDVASQIGLGSLLGTVQFSILQALGCAGAVTNGAVRNLGLAEKMGFHIFAGGISVSHAYLHIIEFGQPVEVGGLLVNSGDLLHGDAHGVQSIPAGIAAQVPAAAEQIIAREQEIIALCHAKGFSLDRLRAAVSAG